MSGNERRVIDHRVLMASAGTGKTYQLTNRMIALLLEGADPSEMVATTFTRKAAGEILERVVERLVEAAENDNALARLGEAVGRTPTRADCVRTLTRIAATLDRVSVLTIDSLFGRMALALQLEIWAETTRDTDEGGAHGPEQDGPGQDGLGQDRPGTRPLLAGDPLADVEGGVGSRRIAEDAEDEAIRAAALALALEEGDDEELLALVRLLLDGHSSSRLGERMLDSIRAGLSILHETNEASAVWSLPKEGVERPPMTRTQVQDLLERMRRMTLPTKKGANEPSARWTKGHDTSMDLAASESWDAFLSAGLGKASIGGTYYGDEIPEDLLEAYRALVEHATLTLRAQLEQRTKATWDLLVRFARVYERMKRERGVWRFEDVPRVLLRHVQTPVLERLYYRMDARVQHLLLDEFQDTSTTSYRLLEPLIEEIVANAPPERSLFCVGDVKQSLYVWNRAEPELLPEIAKRWSQIHRAELVESWRSSPVVLDVVNQVMGTLAENRALDAWPGVVTMWNEMFSTHTAHHKGMPGEVGVHVPASACEKERGKGARGSGSERASLAEDHEEPDLHEDVKEKVRALVEGALLRAPGASIGVLVRANAKIAPLVHALREAGIDASEEGGSSLYDTMPVGVIRSAFQLAAHPGDSAACFHVATSPLGTALEFEWSEPQGIDDRAREVGRGLRRRVGRDGLAQTVAWMVRTIGTKTDARGLRRLEQVIELARRIDEIPGAGIDDFIEALDGERMKDPGASGVRVMTIHASKGLEFDVVILADVDGRMVGPGSPLVVDRPSALKEIRHVMCRPSTALQGVDPGLRAIVKRSTERTLIEGLCVLYVAMTRARYSLQVVLGPRSIKEGDATSETVYPGRLIAAALVPHWPEIIEPGTVFEHSIGDWAQEVRAREQNRGTRSEAVAEPRRVSFTLRSAPSHERQTARLARVSPSSLEGGHTRTLEEVLRPASDEGRLRGTLLHGMFELVGWREDGVPTNEALAELARVLGADEKQASEGMEAIRRALGSQEIAEALSKQRVDAHEGECVELWRERRFAVRSVRHDGEPVLLSGQFDRVVVVREAGGRATRAVLQDFKTDDVRGEETLDARVRHYTPQVEAYRGAIALMLGLDVSRVRAMLLFTEIGRVVEIARPQN